MKRTLGTLFGIGILLAASAASAQQYGSSYSRGYSTSGYRPEMPSSPSGIDNIGNAGQITIGIDRITGLYLDRPKVGSGSAADITHLALLGNFGGSPSTTPRVAVDYFVIDGLSLGGSLTYMSDSPSKGPAAKVFLISPRVGYAYAFDDTFSVWPRASFTYAHESTATTGTDAAGNTVATTMSTNLTQLSLEGMFGISPMKHVAFLVGPYLDLGLGGSSSMSLPGSKSISSKLTSFGLTASILAYY